jgi:hypothetical protein
MTYADNFLHFEMFRLEHNAIYSSRNTQALSARYAVLGTAFTAAPSR